MRLMSLNVWGGNTGDALFKYLKEQSANVDIFCFQEVFNSSEAKNHESFIGRASLYGELCDVLPDFRGYFEMTSKNHDLQKQVNFPVQSGQAVFVKNKFRVSVSDCSGIYGSRGQSFNPILENSPTALQKVQIELGAKKLQVYNFHGVTYPGEKLDSPERLEQSKKILELIAKDEGAKILCGDFNLMPETTSIKVIGSVMKDLIKEYNITNTRNEISWRQYHNIQHFADFAFVSPEIKVLNFEVPYNLVSDHLPMVLDFEW